MHPNEHGKHFSDERPNFCGQCFSAKTITPFQCQISESKHCVWKSKNGLQTTASLTRTATTAFQRAQISQWKGQMNTEKLFAKTISRVPQTLFSVMTSKMFLRML